MIENGKQYHDIPDVDLPLCAQALMWGLAIGFAAGAIVVQSWV